MSVLLPFRTRDIGASTVPIVPSIGSSREADAIHSSLSKLALGPTWQRSAPARQSYASTAEKLHDVLSQAKVLTSKVVMHLERDWRDRLFRQLDELLAVDDWHEEDVPLQNNSFATFLRFILYVKPTKRPGLGLSNSGNLIAAWTNGQDRLTIECCAFDSIRWVLSCDVNGERERAAGDTHVARLPEILRSYRPERWFMDGPETRTP